MMHLLEAMRRTLANGRRGRASRRKSLALRSGTIRAGPGGRGLGVPAPGWTGAGHRPAPGCRGARAAQPDSGSRLGAAGGPQGSFGASSAPFSRVGPDVQAGSPAQLSTIIIALGEGEGNFLAIRYRAIPTAGTEGASDVSDFNGVNGTICTLV